MAKVISAQEAVALVRDGQTVAISGFVGYGVPEELLIGLEERFVQTGAPRNINLMYCAGNGDLKERGMSHLAHEGLIKKVYCSHTGLAPKISKMVDENKIECYALPLGLTVHILRAIAGKKPGVISHVGLGTFVDPRVEGARMNAISKDEVVKLIELEGKEYLFYPSFPLNVAFIRGTTADEKGNITLEKEAVLIEQLLIAMAVKNNGGVVIAQVERLAQYGTLKAQQVKVPGVFVDYVVVGKPENNPQSFASPEYNPSLSGEIRQPLDSLPSIKLDDRKVCARRAAFELSSGDLVNLGLGVSEAVANIATEEGVFQDITLSAGSGAIGGIPLGGLGLGGAISPDAIIDQCYQFDFYDGGGIDISFLGMAEVDQEGNVNVTKFAGRVVGPGGFINISQNAKRLVFCGTFTKGGLKLEVGQGKLKILQEGKSRLFKRNVEQISFSGRHSREKGQKVLYITERAVFENSEKGLVLKEIAPGVDLERDILSLMEFRPIVSEDLKLMDARIFNDAPMGLTLR